AAEHPHVQQQLSLFQQTQLPQEKIVFTNKKVLYRTQKPRVISMWWKIAAAAMLIVAAGMTTYSVLHKSNNTTPRLATTKKEHSKVETTNTATRQKVDRVPADQKKAIVISPSFVK